MIGSLRAGDPAQAGPYVLLGRLAAGGMGQVFVGRSRGGRVVAVKVIHPGLAAGDEFRVRFAREVDAARRVGGYHTAEVVDADAYAERPWMATAYVPGPSLHEAVTRNGVLGTQAVRALGAGLTEALDAIHAAGLVHRDLKPANVLLTADGPRVIDFGIARAVEATSVTTSGDVLGTAAYMSPEQVRGQEAGPASDVFALGCVLHFAATGRSPFGGGPTEAVVYRVVHEEADLGEVPETLRDLVADCLRKDPAARPAVGEVLDRLSPASGGVVPWQLPAGVGPLVAERARELAELRSRDGSPVTEVLGEAGDGGSGTRVDAVPVTRVGDDAHRATTARPAPRRRVGVRGAGVRWAAAAGAVALLVAGASWLVPLLRDDADTVASGTYSLSGEPLEAADAPHTVEIEIVTPRAGEVVQVTYAGVVSTTDDGGTQQGQQTNGEGFTVRTPWTGRLPVESQLLSLTVTAQGEAEDITCRIALDGEPAAEGTASYSSACGVPVDTSTILDGLF
ncbi:Serine/threonine protein kinase [Promicromonospora thailandica]|uniref:Serine/threonine protein kinase n=1 Tax=Promicromonospora thailandica TaxID=765201 RepID=A0A9X2JXU4_9MICO|nr:Serine/threonine protein kinase [Promicromonospora thailandica]